MPSKTQLDEYQVGEIIHRVHEVNAIRTLSNRFKIGHARIRRLWKDAGVAHREAMPVGMQLTTEKMEFIMDLARRLETVQPWPATHDKIKGLAPGLTDNKQLERYVRSLSIANQASTTPALVQNRPLADSFYNAIMQNAFALLPRQLYQQFAAIIKSRKIHR
jgi:hypothetical protein